MRLVSFLRKGGQSWGKVVEIDGQQQIFDLSHLANDLQTAIEQQLIDAACATEANKRHPFTSVTLLPPITRPEKIICIGVNYQNRNQEYKDDSDAPKYPSVFLRTPDSLIGHGAPLIRPPESQQLDYEGEIVVVIGRRGRRIPISQAYTHIAGLTIMNEGTLRDWVRHAKFNVTQGKNFVASGACGPWLVTADEFTAADYEDMRIRTRVNNELRQDDRTSNMAFPIAYQIHYLSTFFTLKPGDMIATGTPTGAGARFNPPRYLKPGDEVEIEVEGVGVLQNGVADEPVDAMRAGG